AGRLAKQAAGSCLLQFGETVVLAAVTVSDNVSTLPFFPLTVEYREKSYAAGKIPGGFLKREGRPSDEEILSARVTDRSVRPLFPDGFKNEVQVFIYVLSADQENDADVLGVTAASAALTMSKVPWNGPIAAVRVGRVARGKALAEPRVAEALNLPEKAERAQALAALKATIQDELAAEFPENAKDVANAIEDIEYHTMRNQVPAHGERVDGRDLDTVRPISCEVGMLP